MSPLVNTAYEKWAWETLRGNLIRAGWLPPRPEPDRRGSPRKPGPLTEEEKKR